MTQTLLKTAADFETELNAQVTAGDTTATLISIADTDGNNLANGLYGFTVDGDVASSKEYIVATLTSTALSGITSISDQGVATTGFSKFHRRGASVAITDWAVLKRVVNVLDGTTNLDGGTPLSYDSTPALGSSNQIATVQYVLDHVNGGAVSFNAEIVAGMAGETITSGQWVYFKESDGRWYKTDATDTTKCLGVKIGKALGAGTAGNAISGGVFIHGLETVGTYSAFTTYYLSDTLGAVATSAGTNSVAVGISDGNSKLIVSEVSKSYLNALVGSVGIPSTANKFVTTLNEYVETDQTQSTQNGSTAVGEANATSKKNLLAQSFKAGVTKIRGVKLYKAADSGSFGGTVTVSLQADSTGSPSGSNLASATITNAQWLLIPTGEFVATFGTEYASMVVLATYWIVITPSTSDNTNHPNIGSNSAGGYANGLSKYKNTTDGWVTLTGFDLYFKILGGVDSQIPVTDSTTGLVPQQIAASSVLLNDIVAGTNVNTTVAETTSYTSTIDTTVLAKTSSMLKIRFNFSLALDVTSTPNVVVRVKLGGITLISWTSPGGSTAATTTKANFELRLTNAGVYIYNVMGAPNVVIATATTENILSIGDYGRGTVSNFPPMSGTQPLLVTVQPSVSSANTGAQVLDMTVTTM